MQPIKVNYLIARLLSQYEIPAATYYISVVNPKYLVWLVLKRYSHIFMCKNALNYRILGEKKN